MNPAKLKAVYSWPTPESRKQVQKFIDFANFNRKFIKGYSSMAARLHQLTFSKRKFEWNPQAEKAFSKLKDSFTSAPILVLPDPK